MKRRHALVAASSLLWAGSAWASQVVLAGRMGERALLVINGRPHTLAVGATAAGVRFVRWQDDLAEVDAGAGPVKLRIGGAPALLSGTQRASSAREIVIPAAGGGHFMAQGSINGQAVQIGCIGRLGKFRQQRGGAKQLLAPGQHVLYAQ